MGVTLVREQISRLFPLVDGGPNFVRNLRPHDCGQEIARLDACSIKTRPSMLALPSARACESAPFDANPPSTPAPPVLCVCLMSVRGPCYHLVRAGVITLKLWR